MRKKTLIMLSMLLGATIAMAQNVKDSAATKSRIQTIVIKTSAVCESCKETLEKAMAYEKGVKESNLHVESKMLTVKYDSERTTPEKIKKAITMAGYDADELLADPKAYENLDACCKKDYKH